MTRRGQSSIRAAAWQCSVSVECVSLLRRGAHPVSFTSLSSPSSSVSCCFPLPSSHTFAQETLPDSLVLEDLTLSIQRGSLVAVVGSTGSGKTAFLMALMRELTLKSGELSVDADTCGWCAQSAVLRTGTIRDNITFDSPFELRRYRRVIEACALDTDLDEMDHGDGTLVGDRGMRLSGGQRQRISLARACYSQSDLVLLDDPLAAVDRITAQHLHKQVLLGILQEKTVVCVLQQVRLVRDFDYVYMLKDGRIEQEGIPSEMKAFQPENVLEATMTALESFLKPHTPHPKGSRDGKEVGASDDAVGQPPSGGEILLDESEVSKDLQAWMSQHLENEHEIEERRKLGGVTRSTYQYYYDMSGGLWAFAPILIALFMQRIAELLLHGCIALLAGHDDELAIQELERLGVNPMNGTEFRVRNELVAGTATSYHVHALGNHDPVSPSTSLSALGTIGPHAAGASVVVLYDLMLRDGRWKTSWTRAKDRLSQASHTISLFIARGDTNALLHKRLPLVLITVAFSGGLLLVGTVVLILQTFAGLRAARRIHDNMLHSVLKARIVFFDINPVGRLLNRFIHDTSCVDEKVHRRIILHAAAVTLHPLPDPNLPPPSRPSIAPTPL